MEAKAGVFAVPRPFGGLLDRFAIEFDDSDAMREDASDSVADQDVAGVQMEEAGAEGSDDLAGLSAEDFSRVVLFPTDWTVSTLLSQIERGAIDINPRFQRRDVWSNRRKSQFIESIFLGLPIPQLVLAQRRERRGSYLVIDGKQRLLTLLQFAAPNTAPDYRPLRLTGLEVRTELNRHLLPDLERDPRFFDSVSEFMAQTIRTVVIRSWPNEQFLYELFLRLNSGSVALNPQELRQALHPGPFIDFADDYSSASPAIRAALRLRRPDFRMRDVELVIRYFAFHYYLRDYRGNLKVFLDNSVGRLNDAWPTKEAEVRAEASEMDSAITCTLDAFGEAAFRRWSGERFESLFNRTVFDIMTFYLREPLVREAVGRHPEDVVDEFRRLCAGDVEFSESLQTTTKSLSATNYRLHRWGQSLRDVLGIDLALPGLANGVISFPT